MERKKGKGEIAELSKHEGTHSSTLSRSVVVLVCKQSRLGVCKQSRLGDN